MTEETAAPKKPKTEVQLVKMEDGREVGFPGKRKVQKETLIDESKIIVDGDTVTLAEGAVSIRMDFRNGKTRTYPLRGALLAKFAGHGAEQKYGDELASPADKPLSEEDMVLAVDELHDQLFSKGEWRVVSEGGGGFAGASHVVLALVEVTGKPVDAVKAFLQKKLDDAKARGEKLSRKELYDSFRDPSSPTAAIIERLEREARAKNVKANAGELLGELAAA